MIVVTGATGHYGRRVVEGLLTRLPASKIGVSVRDPEKAADCAARGVRVNKASFAGPASLAEAFDGAEQVLLVSANVLGDEALRLHNNAIQAAKDAGVSRILYTSHQAASPTWKVVFARDHAATEELLKASGVPFVSLRNGFYAESTLYQLGGMKETGKLALPEDGPVSWTVRDDLAEAAGAALTDPSVFDGNTAPLTASKTYTFTDVARIASDVLGREIARETTRFVSERSKRGRMVPAAGPAVGPASQPSPAVLAWFSQRLQAWSSHCGHGWIPNHTRASQVGDPLVTHEAGATALQLVKWVFYNISVPVKAPPYSVSGLITLARNSTCCLVHVSLFT